MQAVVLVSGGMDSATLLYYVVQKLGYDEVYGLSYAYGQKHDREVEMAKWQCEQLVEVKDWRLIDVSVLGDLTLGASALTDRSIEVPELAALAEDELSQPPTYVPNRNMILLSLAAAYSESRGCRTVFYGAQAQDEYGYWDCTVDFLERLNHLLSLNRRHAVQIQAPFMTMRKVDELRIGQELGVDYGRTWSCYRGGEKACGNCPACVERLKAFAEFGTVDPVEYE